MANRSSIYKGAGIAAGKYRASQERSRGFEYQKTGAAAEAEMNLQKMYETTGAIAEGIGLASSIVDLASSKKEIAKAVEGMKATEKKQSFGDWLVGAEKEYDIVDSEGKAATLKQSELKTAWGAKKATMAEEYDPEKALVKTKDDNKPTMLEEVNKTKEPKQSKGFIGKHKGLDMLGGKGFIGEEKGIDTKTKDWFKSLFKGGADKETTGDNVNNQSSPTQASGTKLTKTQALLESDIIPKDSPIRKSLEGISQMEQDFVGPQMPSQNAMGTQLNPYLGMSFSDAYGAASKSMGGQGTFWWQSEKGDLKEYGF